MWWLLSTFQKELCNQHMLLVMVSLSLARCKEAQMLRTIAVGALSSWLKLGVYNAIIAL